MRKTLGKFVLGTSAFALAILGMDAQAATTTSLSGPITPTVASSPMEVYSATGTIGADPVTGQTNVGITSTGGAPASGPVGFGAVTNGSFGLNSFVSLGQFTVSTLGNGASTTYTNTPFTITYNPVNVNNIAFGNGSPITLSGMLNGTVTGDTSNVVAQFTPGESPVFSTPDGTYKSTLSALNSPLGLVPSTTNNGVTSIQGQLTTTYAAPPTNPLPPSGGITVPPNTPEPTTFAILATSIVGLGLRHRLRSARKSA